MNDSDCMKALYKITHALSMAIVKDLYGRYCLRSCNMLDSYDSVIWMHSHCRTRYFDSSRQLLEHILKSDCFFIPFFTPLKKNVWNSYHGQERMMLNPFYNMTVEEALVKIDLEDDNG